MNVQQRKNGVYLHDMEDFYEDYWRRRRKENYLYKTWIPKRLQIVKSMISIKGKPTYLLDVACGEGTLGKLLKKEFENNVYLVGVDVSKTALEMASEYYDEVHQLDVVNDDIEKIINHKFDYITCLEALDSFIKPENVMCKVKKLMKNNGSIFVSFTNFAFWKYRIDVIKGYFPEQQHLYHGAEHIHYWTFTSFIEFLKGCSLEPVEFDCDFRFPFPLRFLSLQVKEALSKRYPNFFGNQIVMKTRIIDSI